MPRNTAQTAHALNSVVAAALIVTILFVTASDVGAQPKGKGGGGNTSPPADPAIVCFSSGTVVVANADGSNLTAIASGFAAGLGHAWSPDLDGDANNGYQGALALVRISPSGPQVWLLDVSIVNNRPTASNLRLAADAIAWFPSWSPDLDPLIPGYQGILIYSRGLQDPTRNALVTLPVGWNGNAASPSTVHGGPEQEQFLIAHHWINDPVWSSDGQRIAYSAREAGASYNDLYIIDDLLDPQPRLLVHAVDVGGSITGTDWSRTGDTLVFRGGTSLWLVDADDPATLTQVSPQGRSPSWSPDDSAIVFDGAASPGNTIKVRRMDMATGQLTTLVGDRKVSYTFPAWRPF